MNKSAKILLFDVMSKNKQAMNTLEEKRVPASTQAVGNKAEEKDKSKQYEGRRKNN